MPAKTEREFSKWFEAQFGKRPFGPATTATLRREYVAAISEYSRTRERHDVRERWERLRDAAYKAWLTKEAADAAE